MISEELYNRKKELIDVFYSTVSDVNFCTPEIVDLIRKDKYVVELSHGYSSVFGHQYGVTVVNSETKKKCSDLSDSFIDSSAKMALKKAMEYIETLK